MARTPTLFYRAARDGFREFLAHLPVPHGGTVLLPAFLGQSAREGSGVMDPVRELGLTPHFYRINADATTDVEDFERQLRDARPGAAVLIHFYGRTDPHCVDVAELARNAGVPLLEDAAHGMLTAMQSGSHLGRLGDATIYSLHKMLPLPYGGMLAYRNPHLQRPIVSPHPELSESLAQYDLALIGATRRRNFEQAVDLLRTSSYFGTEYSLPWDDLGTDVPQSLPVRVHTAKRDDLYLRLNQMGVGAVSLYHTLVHEIGTEYSESHNLAREVINLPVHQDITEDDIARVVEIFGSCLTAATHG